MSGIVCTGRGVTVYRLLVLKSAVKLERVGIKTRGGSKRAMAARELGLKPRASFDDVLAALEVAIEAERACLEPGEITST